jgi:hypothetical protein
MVTTLGFYLLWLTLVGCLTVAVPVAGILTLAAGLAIVLRGPRR